METFTDFAAAVRKRPAMFFGGVGERGMVEMVRMLICFLAKNMQQPAGKCLTVKVLETDKGTELFLRIEGFRSTEVTCENLVPFFRCPVGMLGLELNGPAAASTVFKLSLSQGGSGLDIHVRDGGDPEIFHKRRTSGYSIQIQFTPEIDIFGTVTNSAFYRIAGVLRDLAILHPGLATELSRNEAAELRYLYADGMRSFLLEEDYMRHDIRKQVLEFRGKGEGMQVEGYLRLLHAGGPRMRSWVNFHPTQGGSDYEGLGRALHKIWGSASGCRDGTFVTNPNFYKAVRLPLIFLGAMHLKWNAPMYDGPTKDTICSKDVQKFIYKIALEQIGEQWKKIKNDRGW